MDLGLYEQFKFACKTKVKADEKKFVALFVQSFQNDEERLSWAKSFLGAAGSRGKIRYELYEGIIFPALLSEYKNGSAWAGLWLARTFENILTSEALSQHFEGITPVQLYQECLDKDPTNDEVRGELVDAKVESMEYAIQPWPKRVIYADGETAVEFLAEVALARALDKECLHTAFFDRVEQILGEDQTRVKVARPSRK